MALMLAIWSAQPNWMPRKPKLMFQICQKLRCGFCCAPGLDAEGPKPPMKTSLEKENLSLLWSEREREPLTDELAGRLVLEEVRDRSVRGSGLDRDRLLDR